MPTTGAMAVSLLIISTLIAGAACLSPSSSSRPQRLVENTERSQDGLNTYAFTASDVDIQTDASSGGRGTPRPGTTRVRVTLTANQLQQAMPVITASPKTGLVHNVIDSFRFLKNYALADSLVSVINQQAGAGSLPLFPKACVAAKASSLLKPADEDTGSTAPASIARFIAAAEATGKRDLWTRASPTNMLMLIPGQAVGAVADVMAVELDNSVAASPAVVLTLDVVHEPHMVNELTDHGEQTLDDDAHYHYLTATGVSVDAAKFLTTLKASGNHLSALHMFAKGTPCLSAPDGRTCMLFYALNAGANGFCLDELCYVATGCSTAQDASGDPCTWPAAVQPYSTCATGTCVVVKDDRVPPGATLTCECPPPCTSGQPCRAAVGNCDVAEVCTAGQCPPDTKQPDGADCAWVPNSGNKHSRHVSADLSSLPATKVSAEEAKARLSSVPAYVKEWPLCKGTCYTGVCALKWDHPACCRVQRTDASSASEGTTLSSGHWEGHDWYCWGY